VVGATIADLGGAPMATRMLGGFILVAFFFCLLLAWPGRRRWPPWLIGGLGISVSGALTFSLMPADAWWIASLRSGMMAMALSFVTTAAIKDLVDLSR
jgi:hypothetical protein